MPLRFDLAPGEKLYLGRSILVNGKTRIDFVLEGTGPVLRERDYLMPSANHTFIEQLYCCLQQMYLEDDATNHSVRYISLIGQALDADQIHSTDAAAFSIQIAAGKCYAALRTLKKMLPPKSFAAAA